MIKDWIAAYRPANQQEYIQALREMMQQIALAGLYRGGFFEKAAFYGGTALRIFYQLKRFSEDLDFSLIKQYDDFDLENYIPAIEREFTAQGMNVKVKIKHKTKDTHIESAFLKSETIWSELLLENIIPQMGLKKVAGVKIKIEVDTKPPLGFETEEKLLLRPFAFYVKCFHIQDLFAGKMHALLFRKWGKNVKGRDWYDMEWYIHRGIALNLTHFAIRAYESGDWNKTTITRAELLKLLNKRIEKINLETAKNDVARFIPDASVLKIWSKDYFSDLVTLLKTM